MKSALGDENQIIWNLVYADEYIGIDRFIR